MMGNSLEYHVCLYIGYRHGKKTHTVYLSRPMWSLQNSINKIPQVTAKHIKDFTACLTFQSLRELVWLHL